MIFFQVSGLGSPRIWKDWIKLILYLLFLVGFIEDWSGRIV